MKDKEFYIGWLPTAPAGFSRHVRKVVAVLAAIFILVACMLALLQRQFSTAVFEFGKLTEVKGIYNELPVPSIKVKYITIPLVGYGKAGAAGIIRELEQEQHTRLQGKEIRLRGTLLYSDGKTLMQLDNNEHPLISIGAAADLPVQKKLGTLTIKGEIVDPKCFFGVMKPGEGKPHRDCAIRCILGGISPVLHIQNAEGRSDYYLLASSKGNIGKIVQDLVAEPVAVTGQVVEQDDWKIIYVDEVKRISKREFFLPDANVVACTAH